MDTCPSCRSPFSNPEAAGLCPACEKSKSTGTLVALLVSAIPFFASLSINSTRNTSVNGVIESTTSGTDYVAVIAGGIGAVLGIRALLRARKVKRPKTAKMAGLAILIGTFHVLKGLLF